MMRDLILKGYINTFSSDRGFATEDANLSANFEAFSAYTIVRKYHQVEVNDIKTEMIVGGQDDGGLDAVAILINGRIVRTIDDVESFANRGESIRVDFIFIQAKSSPHFNTEHIGHFLHGVCRFFVFDEEHDNNLTYNLEISNLRAVARTIFLNAAYFFENPRCFVYYVSSGEWNDNPHPIERFEHGRQVLSNLGYFSEVTAKPIDRNRLKSDWKELMLHVAKEVNFPNHSSFPINIDGIQQAYIGLLSGDQFIKLISGDDGELIKELFYGNVRDFQGDVDVNEEIHKTIQSLGSRNRFPLLNNGITIVARLITVVGNTFRISGYQIVNGCQTSHVLYLNGRKGNIDENVFVPIKLVATDDSQAISEIVKATNRQTVIPSYAWTSLTEFHKELEQYYQLQKSPFHDTERVYYERRSKQFMFDRNVKQKDIVTLSRQIH